MARRAWDNLRQPVARHSLGETMQAAAIGAERKSALWTQVAEAEFPLTAGKIQNLRAACRRLHGTEIPAGKVFSFWKQIGRTTLSAGFVNGRELRSGCMVPNIGGGLCQLSGLLHAAACDAGMEIVEKHAHSRTLPGIPLPPELDATIFWNYVDLRIAAPFAWRLETVLTATDLVVTIRRGEISAPATVSKTAATGVPTRAAAEGDCLTCNVTSCFRHPTAIRGNAPAVGHTAWLLYGMWPEFDGWCRLHSRAGDRWWTPLDGRRWNKKNYAWHPPAGVAIQHATWTTLRRSWRQRRLPGQGAARQNFLLRAQRELAETFARGLNPQARHLVVAQEFLPFLWQAGHLGGRTFDVLATRWPMATLHARLDSAAARHPALGTLTDFRADPELVAAETAALAAAARIVTPHRAIAASFGERAILLDWDMPAATPRAEPPASAQWFFPASPLGRKGIRELADALRETGGELLVLGRARETHLQRDPLCGISYRQATLADLPRCTALVLPAWVEHEPRLALRALAAGIPVIATRACGLAAHPLLTEIDAGDTAALAAAMLALTPRRSSSPALPTAR